MSDCAIRVKQIHAVPVPENAVTQCDALVFALTEDGRVMVTTDRHLDKWEDVTPKVPEREPVLTLWSLVGGAEIGSTVRGYLRRAIHRLGQHYALLGITPPSGCDPVDSRAWPATAVSGVDLRYARGFGLTTWRTLSQLMVDAGLEPPKYGRQEL